MKTLQTLEQLLVDEARRGRKEAESLPLGELRDAVEETAQYAEKLLDEVRNNGTIAWPAFLQRRILV